MKNKSPWRASLATAILLTLSVSAPGALAQTPDTNAEAPSVPTVSPVPPVPSVPSVPVTPAVSVIQMDDSFGSGQPHPVIFSDYLLAQGETKSDDAIVIRGNTTINGIQRGESVTILGDATINGHVTRDVVVIMGSLKLGPEAEVGGDVVVVGGKLDRAPGAKVRGGDVEVFFGNIPGFRGLLAWINEGLVLGRPFPPQVKWVWLVAGLCLGINLLLLLIFPRPIQACVETMEARAMTSFFAGVLAKLLTGLLTVLLLVSMVGILVLPFLLTAYVVAVLFGKITTYRYVGLQAGRLTGLGFLQSPAAGLILGTAIFYLLYMVPYLGFVAWGFSGLFGMGAVVLAALQQFRSERAKAPAPINLGAAPPMPEEYPPAEEFSPAPSRVSAPPAAAFPVGQAPGLSQTPPLLRAGFWLRFFALALDAILFCILFGVFAHRRSEFLFHLEQEDVWMILWLAYHVLLWKWKGTTIGGIIMGIKVVRLDGRPLDFPVALIRALAAVLSFFALGLGFFWVGFSREKQSWHDKIAGTTIVKLPRGMSLI